MYNNFMSVLLYFNNPRDNLGRELLLCEKPFICHNTNYLFIF